MIMPCGSMIAYPTMSVGNQSSIMGKHQHQHALSKDTFWVDDDPDMRASGSDQDCSYTIGELAREFSVTLRALRFYESKLLLNPRRDGQSRIYGAQDRARLVLILQGRRLGFTLGEIRDMINMTEGRAEEGSLSLTREKCFEQISLLEQQKREIETALAELRRIYTSFYVSSARRDLPPQ
jgi:DNA-binding transcriptional MerR regulator